MGVKIGRNKGKWMNGQIDGCIIKRQIRNEQKENVKERRNERKESREK